MATVYSVTHRNGRRFALKMLHTELSIRTDVRKRFLREGYIANVVEHPGAVAVLDDEVSDDGSAFLVMELLDGDTVDGILSRDGRLGEGVVLALAAETLDVLAAAHEKNVVHRDIKPANVFVTRAGDVKVLDFGIARLRAGESASATGTGIALGTPAFMSPEQAMGRDIDARSDVFSAGAMMFTLVTGGYVHEGEVGQELMVRAATEPARPLAALSPATSPAVAAIVDKALAFSALDRWQSAAEMRSEVRRVYAALHASEEPRARLAALVAGARTTTVIGHVSDGDPHGTTAAAPLTAVGVSTETPDVRTPAGGARRARVAWLALAALGGVGLGGLLLVRSGGGGAASVGSAMPSMQPAAVVTALATAPASTPPSAPEPPPPAESAPSSSSTPRYAPPPAARVPPARHSAPAPTPSKPVDPLAP
jgi:serine/threonine-protein kinase